ncbi:MAG TPA: M56 family metallopeptidase [Vicinamibacterales bacterium]|nr:M56 family metallopeptidase [Vicinamibacterales bacterium]
MDAVLNWAWQGCVLALGAEVLLRTADRASAATRHALWWLALLLVLALPALGSALPGQAWAVPPGAAPAGEPRAVDFANLPLLRVPQWKTGGLLLVALWGGWVLVSVIRFLRAMGGLWRVRRACRPFPALREAGLRHWRSLRGRGRRAHLATCGEVRWAGVIGGRTPVIAIAPAVLEALDDRELDQIVAHEWVHVQRRDDVLVILLTLVRAVAGFHPAVWWIGRRLDLERELACDELAVHVTGSGREYARCLTKLASLPTSNPALQLVPAAGSTARLTSRIVRLVGSNGYPSRSHSLLAFSIVAAALLWLAPLTASVVLVSTAAPRAGDAGREVVLRSPGELPAGAVAGRTHDDEATEPSRRPREPAGPAHLLRRQIESSSAREITSRPESIFSIGDVEAAQSFSQPVSDVPGVSLPLPQPLHVLPGASSVPPAHDAVFSAPPESTNPWRTAANSGLAIGRGSQKAAVATAGFFGRFGRRIADSF